MLYKYSGCTGLKEIHSLNPTPPTATTSTFTKVKTNYCKLYVPQGAKEAYQWADGWTDFQNIVETEPEPTSEIASPTITFENQQLKFNSTTEGVTYAYTVTSDDITSGITNCEGCNVTLTGAYKVTAYAKKDGKTSEASTATLVWATGSLNPATSAKEISVDAMPLLITQNGGVITVSGLSAGETISAYSVGGSVVNSVKTSSGTATLDLSTLAGKIAILTVNGKSAKILIK